MTCPRPYFFHLNLAPSSQWFSIRDALQTCLCSLRTMQMSKTHTRLNEFFTWYSWHLLLGLLFYISRFFSSVRIIFLRFCKTRTKFPEFFKNRLIYYPLKHSNLEGMVLLSCFACHINVSFLLWNVIRLFTFENY